MTTLRRGRMRCLGWADGRYNGAVGHARVVPVSLRTTRRRVFHKKRVVTADPSQYDKSVTYTATLTTSNSGSLDINDKIEFQDNGGDIPGCSSQPLMSTPTAGTYTVTSESADDVRWIP